jgi:hypothetical protein
MATDQISFYDESLKKQIEGSFVSDGKSIHVSSVYGSKSVPYNDLGAIIDYNAQVLLVQKLLSELARDPGSGKFKDLHQQKDDQQRQPMQKPDVGASRRSLRSARLSRADIGCTRASPLLALRPCKRPVARSMSSQRSATSSEALRPWR